MMNEKIRNKRYYLGATNNLECAIVTIDELSSDRLLDLAEFDLYTMQFADKSDFIKQLHDKGYIKNQDERVFIGRNNGEYISCYNLLFISDSTRMEVMKKVAEKRLKNEIVVMSDVKILYEFFAKLKSNRLFYEFIRLVLKDLDSYLYSKFEKREDINFRLMHSLNNKITNYHTIRNIIFAWNLFDKLELKYKEMPEKKYENMKNDYEQHYYFQYPSKKIQEELNTKSKNVGGQITITDYINSLNRQDDKEAPVDDYTKQMITYNEQSEKIKNNPFDNSVLRNAFHMGGSEKVIDCIGQVNLNHLTPADLHRLGRIDIVEYNRMISEQRETENAKRNR